MKAIFVSILVFFALTAVVSGSELVAEKPSWQVSDSWTFKRTINGSPAYLFTLKVVDTKARFFGEECYKAEFKIFPIGKVYEESGWRYFSYDFIYLGKENQKGRIEKRFGNKIRNFKWPLKTNGFWRQNWHEPGFGEIRSAFLVFSCEKISVPAGEFETFVIVNIFEYPELSKHWSSHWYSPKVKYLIRQYFYFDNSINELVSYEVR